MSAATMNEIDRLYRERDRAREECDALAARIAELEGYNIGLANEAHELRQQRDALAAMCAEAADVLDSTANDTLRGRNMADKLRQQSEGEE